MPNTR